MKNASFKPEVDHAVEITRAEMLANPGPMRPRLMAFPPDPPEIPGIKAHSPFTIGLDTGMMADWRSKNAIGGLIIKVCFQAKAKVTVLLSDGYGAMTPPPGKTFDDMPNDFAEWPPSLIREALLVFVNAIGINGYFLVYPYSRDGKDRRVFAPEPLVPEPVAVSGARFCYDLTHATEESATLDALHRNRDGVLVPNA